MAFGMFFLALTLLLFGVPVAFAFGSAALLFVLLSPELSFSLFELLPFRIYGIMSNTTLMAVPLFILMGLILEKSKMAEQLLEAIQALFGKFRGGLSISVIIVGALLAASTGIVSASVVMMSIIALPMMLKSGYSPAFASGTVAASGTLGQIIPPSIVLIILGDVMNISVGELFLGALLPGVLLVLLFIGATIFLVIFRPQSMPIALEHSMPFSAIIRAIVPPLMLIGFVLGSIFAGIASPTESAAFGVFGALLLSLSNKTLTCSMLNAVLHHGVQLTGMIFMILIGATAFSLVFNELGGTDSVMEFFTYEIGDVYLFLALSMGVIFLLGFFIDFIEISFIVVPVLVPVAEAFGVDLVWFAVLIAMNLQTSFLTPPFGLSLFFLKGVMKERIHTLALYKGALFFIVLQLIGIALVLFFPGLVFAFI